MIDLAGSIDTCAEKAASTLELPMLLSGPKIQKIWAPPKIDFFLLKNAPFNGFRVKSWPEAFFGKSLGFIGQGLGQGLNVKSWPEAFFGKSLGFIGQGLGQGLNPKF